MLKGIKTNKSHIFLDGKVFGYGRYGGIGRMHYEISKELSRKLNIILFHGLYMDAYHWDNVQLFENIGYFWKWSFRGNARIRERLENSWLDHIFSKKLLTDNLIYHSSYYRIPSSKRKNYKLLVSDFDCVHERYPHFFYDSKEVIAMKHKAFQEADLIATISESSKQDLMHFHGVSETKIRVVHLGVSNVFFSESSTPNGQKRPYILYVGSRAPYKNFQILYDLFTQEKIKKYDLFVIGGEHPLPTKILPAGNKIYWSHANDLELRSIYCSASVFVYPSLYEGFGIPPLEALSCDCPVVASDIPVLREVLGDVVHYFDPLSKNALLVAIQQAINDSLENKYNARKHAQQYNWGNTSKSFLKIYQELI